MQVCCNLSAFISQTVHKPLYCALTCILLVFILYHCPWILRRNQSTTPGSGILQGVFKTKASVISDVHSDKDKHSRQNLHALKNHHLSFNNNHSLRSYDSLHMDKFNICTQGKPLINREFMIGELSQFIKLYEQRPNENYFGTKFAHQFAMWCAVRKLKPLHIIESGIYRGLGTWMLRQAAPDAQLILLDPRKDSLAYTDEHKDTIYLTGRSFTDFKDINWESFNLDLNRTLVYFDDHQSGLVRAFQAHKHGFKYLMFDDNHDLRNYDNFSLKLACYIKLKHLLPQNVQYKENFPPHSRPLEISDLKLIDSVFDDHITSYMEFPLPWSSDDVHNNTLIKNNNDDKEYQMDSPNMHFWYPEVDFHHVCLVKLK